jgi:hypothetical protein
VKYYIESYRFSIDVIRKISDTFGLYVFSYSVACVISAYMSMKYLQMKRNNEEIAQLKAAGKLSEYLKTLHNNMAFHLEIILNQYERTTKIADYRKALAEYCEGEVLETCVGTSRNGKYYPAGTNITFIDWSPNMIEVAISKSYPFIKPKFVIDDVKAMPFPDDSFDTVIDTFGLEYVDEP